MLPLAACDTGDGDDVCQNQDWQDRWVLSPKIIASWHHNMINANYCFGHAYDEGTEDQQAPIKGPRAIG